MKIERIKLAELRHDDQNARTHDQTNLKAIAGSLEQFGQRKPIVITQDNKVVAGNGTLTAAKLIGWTEIDCVRVPADWTADQIKAYALADNRTAELAEWDRQILNAQLLEIEEAGFDIELLGFEQPQVLELETLSESDDLPETVETKTKSGDLWILGNHRLLCGDATLIDDYQKLLEEEKADLVWTDPPYGVAIAQSTSEQDRKVRKLRTDGLKIANDNLEGEQLTGFLRDCFTNIVSFTKPGAVWYVAAPSGNPFFSFAVPLMELEVWKHTIAWVKDVFVLGRADYHYRHESIFYGWTPGAAHRTPADRKQDSVWEIPRPKASKEHPTMKPIELITRAIQNSSLVGEIVLDPFGGSGSTLIAAEQTKRKARLMELDPKYCDVIIQRWENLTGKKAELVNASR